MLVKKTKIIISLSVIILISILLLGGMFTYKNITHRNNNYEQEISTLQKKAESSHANFVKTQNKLSEKKEDNEKLKNVLNSLKYSISQFPSFDRDLNLVLYPMDSEKEKCGFIIFNNSKTILPLIDRKYHEDFGIDSIPCRHEMIAFYDNFYGWASEGRFVYEAEKGVVKVYNFYNQKVEKTFNYNNDKYSFIDYDNDFEWFLLKKKVGENKLYEIYNKESEKVSEINFEENGNVTNDYDRVNNNVIFIAETIVSKDEQISKYSMYSLDLSSGVLKNLYTTKEIILPGKGCLPNKIFSTKGKLRIQSYGCGGILTPQDGDEDMVKEGIFEISL